MKTCRVRLTVLLAILAAAGCQKSEDDSTTTTRNRPLLEQKSQADTQAAAADGSSLSARAPSSSSPASVNVPAAPAVSAGRYLAAEQTLLSGDAMSVEATRKALQSDGFDDLVAALAAQAARDPNARDLGAAYRAQIERQLDSGGRLVDVQCGLSLCMGTIRTRDSAVLDAWRERFAGSPQTPSFVFTHYSKKLASGELDNRFVFSTDPAANRVIMRR